MKKLLTLLLSILVCFSLVGCNKKDNTTNETVIEPTINEIVEVPTIIEEETGVVDESITLEELESSNLDVTTLSYWVNFLNKDGSVLQRTAYKYGETPKFNGLTPTYTDYAYYYSFKGWDKKTSPVTFTQTYSALYDIVGEVPSSKSSTSEKAVTPNYLTFTANIAGSSLTLNKNINDNDEPIPDATIEYISSNTNNKWSTYTFGTPISLTKVGDYVKFRAKNGTVMPNEINYYQFSISNSDSISASGDVTSLLSDECGDISLTNSCFYYLFNGCEGLTSAPKLPSTSLADNCYKYMFCGCTSLTSAPELPATTLASECYSSMFQGCTNLTSAPVLPATTLVYGCYNFMFSGCSELETAPSLPATTLANNCYQYMFQGCTSLTSAPELPATSLAYSCYFGMFSDCSNLVSAPDLPSLTLSPSCYYEMFSNCGLLASAPTISATTLADSCYGYMFNKCTSLISAPALSISTLANSCYKSMFSGCTSLVSAPELPATTLVYECYKEMFSGCTSLVSAPALPATALAEYCYCQMFNGCTGLTTPPALPATTLAESCYYQMFNGCTLLIVSDTSSKDINPSTQDYAKPWSISTSNDYSQYEMFTGCSIGAGRLDNNLPVTGSQKTYYTQNTPKTNTPS